MLEEENVSAGDRKPHLLHCGTERSYALSHTTLLREVTQESDDAHASPAEELARPLLCAPPHPSRPTNWAAGSYVSLRTHRTQWTATAFTGFWSCSWSWSHHSPAWQSARGGKRSGASGADGFGAEGFHLLLSSSSFPSSSVAEDAQQQQTCGQNLQHSRADRHRFWSSRWITCQCRSNCVVIGWDPEILTCRGISQLSQAGGACVRARARVCGEKSVKKNRKKRKRKKKSKTLSVRSTIENRNSTIFHKNWGFIKKRIYSRLDSYWKAMSKA